MSFISTITTKGQVVIPAIIRKKYNLKPSDKVKFVQHGAKVYIEKASSVDTLYKSLHNPKTKPLSTKKMNTLINKNLFSGQK